MELVKERGCGKREEFEPRFRSRLVCGGSYGRLEGCVCVVFCRRRRDVLKGGSVARRQNQKVNFEAGLLAEHNEFAHEVFTPS